jgi:hypothetical protein
MGFGLIVTGVALAVTGLAALAGCLIDRSEAGSCDAESELAEGKQR